MGFELPIEIDGYQLTQYLGEGAFGAVYLAYSPTEPNRALVMKWSDPEAFRTPGSSQPSLDLVTRSFRRETANRVKHENVNPITDLGFMTLHQPEPWPYLISPYLPRSIAELIDDHPDGMPVEDACRIMRQLLAALAHAHAQGVVHRDFKPDNIRLDNDGVVKITDFGISSNVEELPHRQQTTLAGFGSPPWMPHEQRGTRFKPADPTMDVYAFGIIAFELLTGKPPYGNRDGEHPEEELAAWAAASQTGAGPSIRDRGVYVPPRMDQALQACIQVNPRDRPADARSIGDVCDEHDFAPGAFLGDMGSPGLAPTGVEVSELQAHKPGWLLVGHGSSFQRKLAARGQALLLLAYGMLLLPLAAELSAQIETVIASTAVSVLLLSVLAGGIRPPSWGPTSFRVALMIELLLGASVVGLLLISFVFTAVVITALWVVTPVGMALSVLGLLVQRLTSSDSRES